MMSHFLQVHVLFFRSSMKLCSPFLTLNFVSEDQQANHLMLLVFSLCNLLQTLVHTQTLPSKDSFYFVGTYSSNNLMSLSCIHKQPTYQCMLKNIHFRPTYIKYRKFAYHANNRFPFEFYYPTVETFTHIIEDSITQPITPEHVSSLYCCGVSFQPKVCTLINIFYLIHCPLKFLCISCFCCSPKQFSNQETRVLLPQIVVQMSTTTPMFIKRPVICK